MAASKKIARALIALMIVVTGVSALAQPASAQNPVPVIALQLSPGERVAEITASQPAAVQFVGNYTVDKLSFERAAVSFVAVMSTGWVATVSPSSITLTNQRQGTVTVTVVVPPGTPAIEIGQLTVTGRVVAGGLQAQAQAQAIVSPKAYFRVIASSTTPFIEAAYSSQVVLAYKVYNEGNVRDRVKIDIRNLEDLTKAQWVIVLSRTSFTVEPTLSQEIQLTVGLPKQWQLWPDNKVQMIEFVASSGEGASINEPFEDTIPVFIRTVGLSVPGFDLPFVLMGTLAAALLAGAARSPRRRIVK